MEYEGVTTTDKNESSEILNNIFVIVFTMKSENIPEPNEENNRTPEEITIDKEKKEKIIGDINPTKSHGPDVIHPILINMYESKETIYKQLTFFLGNHLMKENFQNSGKELVTTINRSGSKSNPANYRPISVKPICCSIMGL